MKPFHEATVFRSGRWEWQVHVRAETTFLYSKAVWGSRQRAIAAAARWCKRLDREHEIKCAAETHVNAWGEIQHNDWRSFATSVTGPDGPQWPAHPTVDLLH